jgi:hypothetical protein
MTATVYPFAANDDFSVLLMHRSHALCLAGRFPSTLATSSRAIVTPWEGDDFARRSMPIGIAVFADGMTRHGQCARWFAIGIGS